LLPRPKGADEARIIGHQGSARNAVELCLIHTARNRNRILKPKWGRAEGATLMHFPPTPSQFAATRRHFLNPTSPASRSGASLSELEVSFCGVYWTKFECISDKIRRILTNDTCASHWPLASLTMPARCCFVFAQWLRSGLWYL